MGVSRRGRRIVVASVCFGALAAAGLVARQLWLTDTARVVDAQDAIDRFHDQQASTDAAVASSTTAAVDAEGPTSSAGTTTTVPPLATLATPGVYRYATIGTEAIDVLGGTRHDYPAETLLTVTTEGCGVRMRWDLLEERWEDMAVCATTDGIELQQSSRNYHEFFQHGQEQAVQCDRTTPLVPADGAPRPADTLSCVQAGNPWVPVWQVIGRESIDVEGAPVDVTHVRMTVQDDDEYWEHITADYWFDDHGLPVRMTSTKENRSSSGLVGDVVYRETLRADLVSLTPLT
ncbi:MAG: hypothetical protein ACOYMR_06195 [Ilumatobacteraceae bacterium]